MQTNMTDKPRRKPLSQITDDAFDDVNPNALFDALLERFNLKNDAALCRMLDVAPPLVSKIRHGRLSLSAALMLRLHDVTQLPVRELRGLMQVGHA